MTKKERARSGGDDKARRKQLMVVCSEGIQQRFLRGAFPPVRFL